MKAERIRTMPITQKTEYMAFLQYVSEHEIEFVAYPQIFFLYASEDTALVTSFAEEMVVKRIKKARDLDDAYMRVANFFVGDRGNNTKKMRPDLNYVEDVAEYLITLGFEADKALEYAYTIGSGGFKTASRHSSEYNHLLLNDKHFRDWACGIRYLPLREELCKRMPMVYAAFCRERYDRSYRFDRWRIQGMESAVSWWHQYESIRYDAQFDAPINQYKLTVPMSILILPNSFKDAEQLYEVANDWLRAGYGLWASREKGTTMSIGYYYRNKYKRHDPSDKHVFDENSLCVCSTALLGKPARVFAECIMRELGIEKAYLKDEFTNALYTIILRTEEENVDEQISQNGELITEDMARVAKCDTKLPFDIYIDDSDKHPSLTPCIYIKTKTGDIRFPIKKEYQDTEKELQVVADFVVTHYETLMLHWKGVITDRQALNLLVE